MRRFFCPEQNINKDKIIISDSQTIHHIKDVLRAKINDRLLIFDGKEKEYQCGIEKMDKSSILLKINKMIKGYKPNLNVALACALIKRQRFDYIIEKSTELGVTKIIPMYTKRCIINLGKNVDRRLMHWRSIIQNASEQSHRTKLAEIGPVQNLASCLEIAKNYRLALIASMQKSKISLQEILRKKRNINDIIIFIGPEGDFTPDEIHLAGDYDCIPVRLTDTILKVDTACIYALSLIISRLISRRHIKACPKS